MSVQKAAGYIASAVLFFFAVIYALASTYEVTRLAVSVVLFAAGVSILYFVRREKPRELIQRVEVPGRIKAQEIRCPNCSASIDFDHVKVVGGTTMVKCSYCGHSFELVEEPKW